MVTCEHCEKGVPRERTPPQAAGISPWRHRYANACAPCTADDANAEIVRTRNEAAAVRVGWLVDDARRVEEDVDAGDRPRALLGRLLEAREIIERTIEKLGTVPAPKAKQ